MKIINEKLLILTEADFRDFRDFNEDKIKKKLFEIDLSWFKSYVTQDFLKSDVVILQYTDCLKVLKNRKELDILEIIKEINSNKGQ